MLFKLAAVTFVSLALHFECLDGSFFPIDKAIPINCITFEHHFLPKYIDWKDECTLDIFKDKEGKVVGCRNLHEMSFPCPPNVGGLWVASISEDALCKATMRMYFFFIIIRCGNEYIEMIRAIQVEILLLVLNKCVRKALSC